MRRLLVLTLIFFLFVATMPAEKPFDFATTPGKLPKQVVPSEYAIRVEPNLHNLTFTASETIKLEVRTPVRELVLNAADIAISSTAIDGKTVPPSAVKIDTQNELLRIAVSSELPASKHQLVLTFSGKINQQGRGVYYMPYQEEGSGAKKIALGTQFE